MNKDSIEKLKEGLPDLVRLIEILEALEEQDRCVIIRIISKTVFGTALEILNEINQQPKTYEDVASQLDIHPNTVKQYISVLQSMFTINKNRSIAVAAIGRPRKSIQK
jgi:DNA-binding CsgD family transcriptional regulator